MLWLASNRTMGIVWKWLVHVPHSVDKAWTELDMSRVSMSLKALKNEKYEVVVKEMPVCLGYASKVIMELLERSYVCPALLCEVDVDLSRGKRGSVPLCNATNPSSLC
jgi:hypothetical protein